MRYLSVPIESALGGILVHSVAAGRRTVRKGTVLTDDEIPAIAAST